MTNPDILVIGGGIAGLSAAAQSAQIALEQCMRIEADGIAVHDPVPCILFEQGT